jgi:hypothetical protein
LERGRVRESERERERESIVKKLPSSFSARWRPHRAPMMPEQVESMCARSSDNFAK